MSSRKGISMTNVDFMTSKILRDFFEFALSKMPDNMQFYGTISTYALNLIKISSCFRLSVKCDTEKAPQNFHNFKTKLQKVVKQIHTDALSTLETQIGDDVAEMQIYLLQSEYTGNYPAKTNADFIIAFSRLYASLRARLILVNIIDVQELADGFYIDFMANFNDGGYCPANYFPKINLMM